MILYLLLKEGLISKMTFEQRRCHDVYLFVDLYD